MVVAESGGGVALGNVEVELWVMRVNVEVTIPAYGGGVKRENGEWLMLNHS